MKRWLLSSLKNYRRKEPRSSNGYVSFKGPTTYRAFIGRAALTLLFRRSIEIRRTQWRFGPAVGSNPDGLGRKFKVADGWMIS